MAEHNYPKYLATDEDVLRVFKVIWPLTDQSRDGVKHCTKDRRADLERILDVKPGEITAPDANIVRRYWQCLVDFENAKPGPNVGRGS